MQRAEWRGEYRRAIALGEQVVALAAREHISNEALFGQWFLGIATVSVGEYGRGIEVLAQGLALADPVDGQLVRMGQVQLDTLDLDPPAGLVVHLVPTPAPRRRRRCR